MSKLSIVIPTYNRADYLKETLDCFIKQISSSVEIIISDNCSTDNTEEMILELQKIYDYIFYTKLPENLGFDKNILNGLKQATGEYCWIFSSDDLVEDGALSIVLQTIKDYDGLTGISLNGSGYTKDMGKKILSSTVMNYKKLQSNCLYLNAEEAYQALGDYFGFISGQILRREILHDAIKTSDISRFLNGYIHVYIIGKMLKIKPRWLYIQQPIIKWRSGNDSISSLGRVKRLAVDVKGYAEITQAIFGIRSRTYTSIQKRVCNTIVCSSIIETKRSGNSSPSYLISILKLCTPYYWNYKTFWLKTIPIILTPSPLIKSILKIKEALELKSATNAKF